VMPVLDGLEATRRLRRLPALSDVPVIVVSASASAADQQDSFAVGANAFLPKPIDLDRLLADIGSLLQLRWIPDVSADLPPSDAAMPAPLVAPPAEEMRVLHHLAQIGNMRSIRERAEHLATLGEAYRPFARRLCEMADQYQSKAILDLVRKLQGRETSQEERR